MVQRTLIKMYLWISLYGHKKIQQVRTSLRVDSNILITVTFYEFFFLIIGNNMFYILSSFSLF
jgi:hypothetical protein